MIRKVVTMNDAMRNWSPRGCDTARADMPPLTHKVFSSDTPQRVSSSDLFPITRNSPQTVRILEQATRQGHEELMFWVTVSPIPCPY